MEAAVAGSRKPRYVRKSAGRRHNPNGATTDTTQEHR